ncbi:MAG: sensor histidine kinase N-terminal domain-containing protein [Burkholderiaceae bacterium]|nr:sensor histidine kinase N-terminal domain-containing protein [Burkholderiaceae bacterium]
MLAPLLLMWPMSLALTWLAAQGIASRPYDRALIESVRSLAQRIELRGENLRLDLPQEMVRMLRADEADSVYYQVLDTRGVFLSGDRELPVPLESDARVPGELRLRDDEVDGESVRVAYQWVQIGFDEGPALVQVAETLTKRSRLATEIIKGVILPQFVILPIAVLLVWMALVRGLAPLNALQQRIRKRRSDDLSPIDEREVPEEVTPLVQAINELLERQRNTMTTQKRFLADAAHQLKTPLAGLRMQAELAARELETGQSDSRSIRASLEQMANASQRAAHMVNQLLSMARTEARAGTAPRDVVDLHRLATDVVRDFVPRALDKGIDLGYEGPEDARVQQPAAALDSRVLGHEVMLRELLVNLVDNALQYTPPGGTVTVRVMPDPFGQVVALQVEDSGPGIPAAERELVFQPFYRALGTKVDGSGLGLAIVAEVAQQHGAELLLEDARAPGNIPPGEGPGVCFTLRLHRPREVPAVPAAAPMPASASPSLPPALSPPTEPGRL